MRLTTLLRRLLGVTQMYVKQVEMAADGPLTVSVEPSWRRSRCGTCGKRAPRYDRQPVRQWRHLSMGPDAGVAAVCAVAGVVPALPRGEGGAGAVGERHLRVHVGVRGIGGVSGAGDGPDSGEPPAGDIVGDGGQHRGTGCGAAAGRGSVRQAETNRRR